MQPRDGEIIFVENVVNDKSLGCKAQGRPKIGLAWPLKFRSHDANNFVGLLIELDGTVEDVRVAAKNCLPRVVRQNHFAIGIWLIFFWRERAAQQGPRFEHLEPLPGYSCATQTQRPRARGVVKVALGLNGCGGEGLGVVAHEGVVRRGNHNVLEI